MAMKFKTRFIHTDKGSWHQRTAQGSNGTYVVDPGFGHGATAKYVLTILRPDGTPEIHEFDTLKSARAAVEADIAG